MRESNFVKQNQEKWANFEQELSSSRKDPDQLRAQLIQTTDDLSYARTFYKNRSGSRILKWPSTKNLHQYLQEPEKFSAVDCTFFKERNTFYCLAK